MYFLCEKQSYSADLSDYHKMGRLILDGFYLRMILLYKNLSRQAISSVLAHFFFQQLAPKCMIALISLSDSLVNIF